MRIGYFADGPWAHKALRRMLINPDYKVLFIVVRHDTQDPILIQIAKETGIPWYSHSNVNSRDFVELIRHETPDLLVSMSFNQIIKQDLISLAPLGFINCHAGELPFYRGRNVLNWALINGESRFGVTVHYIDEGIDTGDIILQRYQSIDQDDDYASVLRKATELCAETLLDALKLISEEKVVVKKQDEIHPVGFYCGRRLPGDEFIDWNWSSERIHNFVRAITEPAPGAQTFIDGQALTIWKTSMISNAPSYIGVPGEVVGRNPDGVIVKTGDSTLMIREVSFPPDVKKIVPQFRNGTRLGINYFEYIKSLENRIQTLESIVNKNADHDRDCKR